MTLLLGQIFGTLKDMLLIQINGWPTYWLSNTEAEIEEISRRKEKLIREMESILGDK